MRWVFGHEPLQNRLGLTEPVERGSQMPLPAEHVADFRVTDRKVGLPQQILGILFYQLVANREAYGSGISRLALM